jgi:hypothetical protein
MSAGSDQADRWRARALEAFSVASEMTDPQAKAVMVKIANGYEHLARLAAKAAPQNEHGVHAEPPETHSAGRP